MNTFYFNFPTFLRSTQSCHTLITYSHLPLILVLVKGWLHGKLAPVWPVEELTQYQHACNILIVLGNWRTGPILGPSRPCLAAGVCISYNYRMERIWSNGKETYRHFLLYVLAALLFIIFLTQPTDMVDSCDTDIWQYFQESSDLRTISVRTNFTSAI